MTVWQRLARAVTSAAASRPATRRRARVVGAVDAPVPADIRVAYAPRDDGDPDPGEVVWTWVPFEEGDGRGKDRPVLVVARHGRDLLALMMTSRDHDGDDDPERPGDLAAEHHRGRPLWMDVGAGTWDARRRPSEVRLDRVLTVAPGDVRRQGARLGRDRFEHVARALRELYGWG